MRQRAYRELTRERRSRPAPPKATALPPRPPRQQPPQSLRTEGPADPTAKAPTASLLLRISLLPCCRYGSPRRARVEASWFGTARERLRRGRPGAERRPVGASDQKDVLARCVICASKGARGRRGRTLPPAQPTFLAAGASGERAPGAEPTRERPNLRTPGPPRLPAAAARSSARSALRCSPLPPSPAPTTLHSSLPVPALFFLAAPRSSGSRRSNPTPY